MTGQELAEFSRWLRTVDNLDRELTKTEYKVITNLIDQAYENKVPFEAVDRLHWFIEKKDTCPTCGDERCGCQFHQQTCSHIIEHYMKEQDEMRARGEI